MWAQLYSFLLCAWAHAGHGAAPLDAQPGGESWAVGGTAQRLCPQRFPSHLQLRRRGAGEWIACYQSGMALSLEMTAAAFSTPFSMSFKGILSIPITYKDK